MIIAGAVAAIVAAFFSYLAVPRPSVYVARFQMIVDVARHRAAFHAQINNAGGAADIAFISVGEAVRHGMPTWQAEVLYPGARWHRLLPLSPYSVSVSFPLNDTDGFLRGRFGIAAELAFRAHPTFLGGGLFEDEARLSYWCKTGQITEPPYANEFYAAECATSSTSTSPATTTTGADIARRDGNRIRLSVIVIYWLLGLGWSLLIGHVVVSRFLNRLRGHLERAREAAGITGTPPWRGGIGIPPSLVGTLERLFFTIAVAFDASGFIPGMMAWLGVKMLVDWNRPDQRDTAGAMSALIAGLASMLFALTGGLICRGLRSA